MLDRRLGTLVDNRVAVALFGRAGQLHPSRQAELLQVVIRILGRYDHLAAFSVELEARSDFALASGGVAHRAAVGGRLGGVGNNASLAFVHRPVADQARFFCRRRQEANRVISSAKWP